MIRISALGHALGMILLALAASMLVPIVWGAIEGGGGLRPLLVAAACTAATGGALAAFLRRPDREIQPREAALLVVVCWVVVSLFGALPFYMTPDFPTFTDAYFESVSGFTTTGATVLADVEALARPVQFWRCFTHWLGGMGIVLLAVAILPLVGHGGMHLYRAEFSGARSEKLRPRIAETAIALWKIYVALTVVQYAALRWAGLDRFESACHAFSTLGTGGFSTRTASVAAFANPTVEWVIIVFMLLAGMSFIQHFRLFVERRPRQVAADYEIRLYLAIASAAVATIAAYLYFGSGYAGERAIRASAFQVVSILTTTGFATEDFELWLPLPQVLLLALMFVGGCTGSTSGGLKVSRIALLARVVDREFRRMVERRGVFAVRLGNRIVPEETVQSLLNLVYLAFVVNFGGVLILAAFGVDVMTSISAVAACMFNVGPGLGAVGPTEHYAHLPGAVKWTLVGCMIAGRLEFYTVLVLLTPAFWRR